MGRERQRSFNLPDFIRGRGTIKFIYTFQGERYMGRNMVMRIRTDR